MHGHIALVFYTWEKLNIDMHFFFFFLISKKKVLLKKELQEKYKEITVVNKEW